MTIIKIDDKDYDSETLSDEAKAQLQNVQFVDQELARLNAQTQLYYERQSVKICMSQKLIQDPLNGQFTQDGSVVILLSQLNTFQQRVLMTMTL